jgi:hypothetical protein
MVNLEKGGVRIERTRALNRNGHAIGHEQDHEHAHRTNACAASRRGADWEILRECRGRIRRVERHGDASLAFS